MTQEETKTFYAQIAAARAAKADADKQKRIEELQAELDALNGDKN